MLGICCLLGHMPGCRSVSHGELLENIINVLFDYNYRKLKISYRIASPIEEKYNFGLIFITHFYNLSSISYHFKQFNGTEVINIFAVFRKSGQSS